MTPLPFRSYESSCYAEPRLSTALSELRITAFSSSTQLAASVSSIPQAFEERFGAWPSTA